jgi:8-oxo-dGTP diphosphatase
MEKSVTRPLVGVGVVLLREGRVFLAKRRGSHGEATWASAGGHLEFGETLEECARREAQEELGVAVGHLRFLCVSNILAYGKHYLDVEFLGDIGEQEPRLAEPDAFSEYGWFPLDRLPQPLFEAARYALDSLTSGRHYYPAS